RLTKDDVFRVVCVESDAAAVEIRRAFTALSAGILPRAAVAGANAENMESAAVGGVGEMDGRAGGGGGSGLDEGVRGRLDCVAPATIVARVAAGIAALATAGKRDGEREGERERRAV